MKCKKCRKSIPDGSKFCNHCGAKQGQQKMYRRPDGLYEKSITINGKRKVFRGKSEKDIIKKIAEFDECLDKGEFFSVVADNWHTVHFPTLSPTTQKGYKHAYEEIIEYFGNYRIKLLTPKDIKTYIFGLPKSYARKTCATRLLILNLIFNYAVSENLADENICSSISIPKGHPSKRRRAPNDEEITIIESYSDFVYNGLNVGFLAMFMLYTGLRKGEALALRKRDIDILKKTVNVNRSVYYESTTPYIKQPKTEAGTRCVIIPDKLIEQLKTILRKLKSEQYIFSNTPDTPINGSAYNHAWEAWQKATSLKLTAHQLRHGYATLLLEADVNVKDAQDLLGHADASTTQNIYQEVRKNRKQDTANKINTYFSTANTQNTQ